MQTKPSKFQNLLVSVSARYFAIAASVAPKGDVRYYLNGVYIEPVTKKKGGGAIMVGTDGHRMILMHDKAGTCEAPVIIRAVTPSPMMSACTKSAMGSGFGEVKLILTADNSLLIGPAGIDANDPEAVAMRPTYRGPEDPRIDGKYPDFRRVIPPAEELTPGLPGAYNGSYLADFCKLAKLIDSRYSGMKFYQKEPNGETNSIVVRCPSNDDFIGILMPMRDAKNVSAIPDWLKSAA